MPCRTRRTRNIEKVLTYDILQSFLFDFGLFLLSVFVYSANNCRYYYFYYTVSHKKNTFFIMAITFSTTTNCHILAHIYCRKLTTTGCIVSPPNIVYVTALPCKKFHHYFTHCCTCLLLLIHRKCKKPNFRPSSCL